MKKIITLFIAFSFLMTSCSFMQDEADILQSKKAESDASLAEDENLSDNEGKTSEEKEEAYERILDGMTLEEKIGQLFIVFPESLCPSSGGNYANKSGEKSSTEFTREMSDAMDKYRVGGIVLFSKNIVSQTQLPKFISDMQSASEIPMFISVDEEGGRVARIAGSNLFGAKKYKNMASVGASGNTEAARDVGRTIGGYLKPLGFNLDFAPDADVNTNPKNIVIGDRSFGSDPKLVADMVCAQLDGMHEAGVMGCIKHFPGHGDTTADTHSGYVKIEKTWDELKTCELIPFISALDTTDMVMAAHITAVNITKDGLPSSISEEMISGKLRGELGYDGVIITDAMNMGAIAKNYSSADAAVKAIKAGVDIILMPKDLGEAADGLKEAVESGEISEERIDESVSRILRLKQKYEIIK